MKAGELITFGNYEWRVLDVQSDRVLLITEDMIGQHPYHNKAGNVTWKDCELRSYLNTEFYKTFSEEDRKRIITVINKNPNNEWYDSNGGEDSKDKIFLLSIEEVACKYFGDSSTLLYNPGKNQKYWFQRKDENNSNRRSKFGGYGWWWWLRSPGRDNKRAVYIWGDGNIGIQGNGTYKYSSNTIHPITKDNSGGIRPALWIKR
ncbi:DUF6273 domain-containing protein [Breznakia pachnodae]|uniref:DUF6273 domain-containing protein n=1 Tax=Breznakia pachnodae TaxID=265178 RepID=A0ABU0E580_9FIRM|nr:DUF6273 domain-containing protein [Breznakia pachnodae]MDQ0362054.1 hypothetical protein [Breznakia pachnodae]